MKNVSDHLVFKTRSKYGQVAVKNFGGIYKLVLNRAYTHSIYDPVDPITNEDYWDFLLLGQLFIDHNPRQMCILGLGGGTAVTLFNRYFPPLHIDGVEIDPEIIKVGKKYLGLKANNVKIFQADAKEFIKTTAQTYDLIIVDVFKPTGQEESCNTFDFYQDVKKHLTDTGVLIVNHFDTTDNHNLLKNFDSIFRVKINLNQVYFCQKTKHLTLKQINNHLDKLINSSRDFKIFQGALLKEVV